MYPHEVFTRDSRSMFLLTYPSVLQQSIGFVTGNDILNKVRSQKNLKGMFNVLIWDFMENA